MGLQGNYNTYRIPHNSCTTPIIVAKTLIIISGITDTPILAARYIAEELMNSIEVTSSTREADKAAMPLVERLY